MVSKIKQKGFTIVELLIVIVVIAILAAISIVAYNNVTQKARDDGRVSDARNIVNALSSYHSEEGEWIKPSEVSSKLGGYQTVKISEKTLGKINTTDTPSKDKKDSYKITECTTDNAPSGAKLEFYKEAENKVESFTAGTGC